MAHKNTIDVSAEDKFCVVDMTPSDSLPFPHPFTFGNFGRAMGALSDRWEFIWDYRNATGKLYNDLIAAYEEATMWYELGPVVARPGEEELIADVTAQTGARILAMRDKRLPQHTFDLWPFDDDNDELLLVDHVRTISEFVVNQHEISAADLGMLDVFDDELIAVEEDLLDGIDRYWEAFHHEDYEKLRDGIEESRAFELQYFLERIGVNSLLNELAILRYDENVIILPYHSFSLHNVEANRDQTVLLRPGRESARYWAMFGRQIKELERLLSENANEFAIESLLRRNPLFLRGLNYKKVYPQVILPTGPNTSLRPDLIAEPIGDEWCNIIDLKLGSAQVLVGSDNRRSLAYAIHSVAAQLREYEAYFDDRRIARAVEEKYGFKCYKPKLVAIIGRDPKDLNDEQVRRAMTAYPNLEIVTYDRLLRASKELILL